MRLREHPPHFLASNGTDPSPGDTDACWHRSSGGLSSLQIIGRFHERRGVRCEHVVPMSARRAHVSWSRTLWPAHSPPRAAVAVAATTSTPADADGLRAETRAWLCVAINGPT